MPILITMWGKCFGIMLQLFLQVLAFSKTNNPTAQTSKTSRQASKQAGRQAGKQAHKLANATTEFLIIN